MWYSNKDVDVTKIILQADLIRGAHVHEALGYR